MKFCVLYLVIKWRHKTFISFIFKLYYIKYYLDDKLLKIKLYLFILANKGFTIKMKTWKKCVIKLKEIKF